MLRLPLSDGLSRFLLIVGVLWGIGAFFLGCMSVFAVPLGNDCKQVIESLVALISLLIILPITLAANWIPKVSAVLLILSFLTFECVIPITTGFAGVLAVALKLGLPTCALAGGYVLVAYVPTKSPDRRDAATPKRMARF